MATIRKKRDQKGNPYWEIRWRSLGGERKQRVRNRAYADRVYARAIEEETQRRDPLSYPLASDATLGKVIDEWWAAESPYWAGSTRDTRRSVLANHVPASLRQRRVRHIRPGHIEALLRERSSMLSAASVGRLRMLLRRVWRFAVAHGYAELNVVDAAEAPKMVREALADSLPSIDVSTVLAADEVRKLADTIDPRYSALVLVLGTVGLRIREAAALRVADVDLDRLQLSVVSVQDRATKHNRASALKAPKTAAGARVCFIPGWLADELRPLIEGREESEFVFTAPSGGMLNVDNWRKRMWDPAVRKLDYRHGPRQFVTPHWLRHTAATTLLRANVNPKAICRQLGWANPQMLFSVYAGVSPEDGDDVRAALS